MTDQIDARKEATKIEGLAKDGLLDASQQKAQATLFKELTKLEHADPAALKKTADLIEADAKNSKLPVEVHILRDSNKNPIAFDFSSSEGDLYQSLLTPAQIQKGDQIKNDLLAGKVEDAQKLANSMKLGSFSQVNALADYLSSDNKLVASGFKIEADMPGDDDGRENITFSGKVKGKTISGALDVADKKDLNARTQKHPEERSTNGAKFVE